MVTWKETGPIHTRVNNGRNIFFPKTKEQFKIKSYPVQLNRKQKIIHTRLQIEGNVK